MAVNDIPNTQIKQDDDNAFVALLFNFAIGKFQLLPDHRRFLIQHVNDILGAPAGELKVFGSASNTGNRAFNITLSRNRAKEVCMFLQHQLEVPSEKFDPYMRDKKTGEGVGLGTGPQGVRGNEDGQMRMVAIVFPRHPLS